MQIHAPKFNCCHGDTCFSWLLQTFSGSFYGCSDLLRPRLKPAASLLSIDPSLLSWTSLMLWNPFPKSLWALHAVVVSTATFIYNPTMMLMLKPLRKLMYGKQTIPKNTNKTKTYSQSSSELPTHKKGESCKNIKNAWIGNAKTCDVFQRKRAWEGLILRGRVHVQRPRFMKSREVEMFGEHIEKGF